MVTCVGVGAIDMLIFPVPCLSSGAPDAPWYPFGPDGKEGGDQTLIRSYPTGMIPIRPPFHRAFIAAAPIDSSLY